MAEKRFFGTEIVRQLTEPKLCSKTRNNALRTEPAIQTSAHISAFGLSIGFAAARKSSGEARFYANGSPFTRPVRARMQAPKKPAELKKPIFLGYSCKICSLPLFNGYTNQ